MRDIDVDPDRELYLRVGTGISEGARHIHGRDEAGTSRRTNGYSSYGSWATALVEVGVWGGEHAELPGGGSCSFRGLMLF